MQAALYQLKVSKLLIILFPYFTSIDSWSAAVHRDNFFCIRLIMRQVFNGVPGIITAEEVFFGM